MWAVDIAFAMLSFFAALFMFIGAGLQVGKDASDTLTVAELIYRIAVLLWLVRILGLLLEISRNIA